MNLDTNKGAGGRSVKLDKEIILTVYGNRHESILLTISEILYRFKGIFLKSDFNRIGHQFSGLMHIAINHMYLKPFIACLDSLSSFNVRFDTQILQKQESQELQEQIRFNFEVWGEEDSEFRLKLMQLLTRHHLVIESVKDSIKLDASGIAQFNSQISVATSFVVDEQEVEEDLQALTEGKSITVMLLNQELADGELDLQEAI